MKFLVTWFVISLSRFAIHPAVLPHGRIQGGSAAISFAFPAGPQVILALLTDIVAINEQGQRDRQGQSRSDGRSKDGGRYHGNRWLI